MTTTMAASSEATVPSPVAHFRKLLAAKKLQRQSSPSPSEESSVASSTNRSDPKAETKTNSENHHPNNAQSTSAKPTPRRLARGLGNSRLQQTSIESLDLETSTWAMVGNHLDETNASSLDGASFASGGFEQTFEQTFHTAELAITPAPFKENQNFEWDAEEVRELLSPLFKNQDSVDDGIVGDDGIMSPMIQNDKENGNRVKWALEDDDVTTPKNGGLAHTYRKSPFIKGDMTPSGTPILNELNESAVVSDHEEDSVSESHKGELFPDTEFVDELLKDGFEEEGRSFDSPPSIRERLAFEDDSMETESEDGDHVGLLGEIEEKQPVTEMSPTKEALKERAKFLATEVRFADQTCVELSQKLKNEKKQAGRFKHDLGHAMEEHKNLQRQHESTVRENAKLKVLLEAQKEQASIHIEEYRAQIATMQEDHRSSLQEWEHRYASHMKNTENQINALNERLAQSIAVNSTLQNRLDKWDSRLLANEASKEVIVDLKERAEAAEASASKADATIQTMQARIYDLQGMCDQHQNTIQRERNEREMAENDRDYWRRQCEDLHKQLTDWHGTDALDSSGDMYFNDDGSAVQQFIDELKFTPIKGGDVGVEEKDSDVSALHHSPTSKLLARTLRSEQKRRKVALSELDVAQLEVEKLEYAVEDLKVELEEAKADNLLLEEDLQDKCLCIEEMKGALAQKDEQIELLMEELDVLGNEASADTEKSFSSSKSGRGRAIDDLEGRLEVTQKALESTEEELLATRRKLAESESVSEEIAGELGKAEQELAEAEEQMLEYDDRVVALDKELREKQDFSEFQTRTIDTLKSQTSQREEQIKEYNIQLKSSLHALVKVERILRTYEDSDDLAKKKLGEQSRKIARLEETIKAVKESLSNGASSAKREVETASTMTPVTHLLAQSPVSNISTPSALNEDNGYYREKLDELHGELATAHERCDEVEKERDDISNELKRALRCVQEFRDELSTQEHEHSQETSSLERQLEDISTQKEELVQKCTQLEQELATMATELSQRKMQSEALAHDVALAQNEASHQMAVVMGNNSEALQENESLRIGLDALQIELQNAQSLLKAANEECEGSHKDVKAAKAAFECLQAESMLTKNTLRKAEEAAAMLKTSLDQKEAELKKKSDSLAKAQELLQLERTKFEGTQESIRSLHQDEIKTLQNDIHELEFQVSEIEELRNASDESLNNASNRINVLESMISAKSQECELYQAECEDLTALLKKKEDELRSTENNLAGAEEELSEAQATMHDQIQDIEQLNDKVKECKLCMEAYEESLIKYKEQVRHLQAENFDLQRELEDAVGSYQTVVHEKENQVNMLKEACTKRQILFDEQLAKAKLERDSTTSDFEAMIEILQTQLNSKDEDVKQAKSLISAKDNLLNEKDAKISECKDIISDLKSELLEQDNVQKELEQEIVRKQGQIEMLQNSLNEAGDEIAQTKETLYSLEMTHEDLVESKNAVERELESTLMDIERMKTNYQDDQSTSNSLIKDLQNEIDELYAQKKSAQDSVTALTFELREAKEKLSNFQLKLQAEGESNSKRHHDINGLLSQNALLTKKCNIFKEKLKQSNDKLRDWETSYKLQSKDLVDYGCEISRLNTEKNTLKAELLAVRGSSDRYKSKLNRINQAVNTPDSAVQTVRPTTI